MADPSSHILLDPLSRLSNYIQVLSMSLLILAWKFTSTSHQTSYQGLDNLPASEFDLTLDNSLISDLEIHVLLS